MTMSVVVTIGGTNQDTGTLAVVVGSSVRGTQNTPSSPPFGPYAGRGVFQITIYANAGGETLNFLFTDGSTQTTLAETTAFVVNGNEGSVTAPFALSATTAGAAVTGCGSGRRLSAQRRLQSAGACSGTWETTSLDYLTQASATIHSVAASTVSKDCPRSSVSLLGTRAAQGCLGLSAAPGEESISA